MIKKWLNKPLTENAKWIIEQLCYIPIGISLLWGFSMFNYLEENSYALIAVCIVLMMAALLYYLSSGSYELQKNESKGFRKFFFGSTLLTILTLIGFFNRPNLINVMSLFMLILVLGVFNLIFYRFYLHLEKTKNDIINSPTDTKP